MVRLWIRRKMFGQYHQQPETRNEKLSEPHRRLPHHTISSFLADVCETVIAEYGDEVVNLPQTQDDWLYLKFDSWWNFHNAIGVIDGKLNSIKALKNSGSVYHRYKAIVDAGYKHLSECWCQWINLTLCSLHSV